MRKFAIILAAGKGTRMKSDLPKVMHKIAEKPMISHVLDNFSALKFDKSFVVVGFGADQVIDVLPEGIQYVEQLEQNGTGHAVKMVGPLLARAEGMTLVGYGDMPLITSETLSDLMSFHEEQGAAATVLTGIATNPFGYGRIVREHGEVSKIVEQKDANELEQAIQEVNTGIYVFDNRKLFSALSLLKSDNAQGELYLTDVIEIFKNEDEKVCAYPLENFDESLGINDRVQLATAEKLMQARINEKHMLNGVTLIDPTTTRIGADVKIGNDSVIEGNTALLGKTVIGKRCLITSGSRIIDSRLSRDVTVNNSTVESTIMDSGSNCGPYAHLRQGAVLHEDVHVGNFVEVKGSSLGRGTKAGHLTYIGNSIVGEKVNFGAGTITANFDGRNKYTTEIDDFAFIGSNTTLIAPVHIGKNAVTAGGSTITKDVVDDAVAIGRARQVDKLGLAKKMPHYRGN
ncbi:MAG: bifunctional UDP-N-acetylglucosamine diphosphorylase/glucosamine-1-phosphate N-acetyltransferase GlmU [Streptococcaceae bacterium]|jgi:bifunctional UDP-N-acetylglucosamine pyrophosphorylase/glucosamine-1-phosphate N-acetyltransferase|nr:bifunctional UDP-N-acetylglucosamine diphosphorylase/glucosamine-1-phosphate N-acetyltransferase GlmU [Streptococcaceae bacterium]